MSIRVATFDDIPAIHDCHDKAILQKATSSYSQDVIEEWLSKRSPKWMENDSRNMQIGWVYLVYEKGEEIFGVASFQPDENKLGGIYTRNGVKEAVGQKLIKEVIKLCKTKDCSFLDFESSVNARNFYEAQGAVAINEAIHIMAGGQKMPCVKMKLQIT